MPNVKYVVTCESHNDIDLLEDVYRQLHEGSGFGNPRFNQKVKDKIDEYGVCYLKAHSLDRIAFSVEYKADLSRCSNVKYLSVHEYLYLFYDKRGIYNYV